MLLSKFKHTVDAKNRVFIPAKYREELGETFVVSKSLRQPCLQVYSMEQWEAYISPITKMDRKDSEPILRRILRDAEQVSPDSQGRIVLPSELVKKANIGKSAVIVGCCTYAEIWAEEEYDKMIEEEDPADLIDRLEAFGL